MSPSHARTLQQFLDSHGVGKALQTTLIGTRILLMLAPPGKYDGMSCEVLHVYATAAAGPRR